LFHQPLCAHSVPMKTITLLWGVGMGVMNIEGNGENSVFNKLVYLNHHLQHGVCKLTYSCMGNKGDNLSCPTTVITFTCSTESPCDVS
jgi:hypothetical protein